MSSHDGIIELNREITRLESALAAERADCARAKESLDERCKTIIEQRTRIDFLDPYCKRLEEELAAEREKVVGLAALRAVGVPESEITAAMEGER